MSFPAPKQKILYESLTLVKNNNKKQKQQHTNKQNNCNLLNINPLWVPLSDSVCLCVCVQTTFHYNIFWSMLIHFKAFNIMSQRRLWMYHLIFNLYDTPSSSTHHHEFGMSTSTQHMLVIQHVPSTPNQTIVVDQCLQIAAAFVCARRPEALLNHSG